MRIILIYILLTTLPIKILSQLCEGNLGINIFQDGDFGSGSSNLLLQDPGIAPGYIYQFNPPPDDGFYTITNNTGPWGSFARNWDDIRDNSNDPNGYMMVVNASFETGVFYEQNVDGLCENTLYVFSADVYNLINSPLTPNISFQLDGVSLFTSGSIPYNRQWNTYGFSFMTGNNQTSLTLTIRNNAPGGNGNDLALDNISFRTCGPTALILPLEIDNICEDGNPIEIEATIVGDQYTTPQYQWQRSADNGMTWEDIPGENTSTYIHSDLQAGFYYYRYLLANDPINLLNEKCRVISNVKTVYVQPKFYSFTDTICEGLEYQLGEDIYTDSGTYEENLLSAIGCDSIVTLNLTVLPDPNITIQADEIDPSCSHLEDGSINVISINNAELPYSILVNGVLNENDGNLDNLPEGSYEYFVTDRFGCNSEAVFSLMSPFPLTVGLGEDREVDLGESIILNPIYSDPVVDVVWSSIDSINCNMDCGPIEYLPSVSQVLSVMAFSEQGCIGVDTINIKVNAVRNVYIPNVFSPNADGVNSAFTVFGKVPNVSEIEKLFIYDRWGNLIFKNESFLPNDLEAGWSGSLRNRNFNPGVYTYIVKVRFLDNVVETFVGSVTLLE